MVCFFPILTFSSRLPGVHPFIGQIDVGHENQATNLIIRTKHVVGPLQGLAVQALDPCKVELFYPDGPWPGPGGVELDVRA